MGIQIPDVFFEFAEPAFDVSQTFHRVRSLLNRHGNQPIQAASESVPEFVDSRTDRIDSTAQGLADGVDPLALIDENVRDLHESPLEVPRFTLEPIQPDHR